MARVFEPHEEDRIWQIAIAMNGENRNTNAFAACFADAVQLFTTLEGRLADGDGVERNMADGKTSSSGWLRAAS